VTSLDPEVPATELSAEEAAAFRRLLDKLKAEHRFDLHDYKSASLVRRVRTRMTQVHAPDFDAYARLLDMDDDEATLLLNTILINVTGFFRDPEAWAALRQHVVPALGEHTAASGSLRLWSAGCSTGEEAYSLAILLAERAPQLLENDVKIYATDVDADALTTARQALYRLEQLKDLPEGYIGRYFSREGQFYRFRRELRRLCIFGRHNLVDDPPLARMDLIVCRNVLIYFKTALQERLLPRFYYAIRDDGFLFLGKSESLLARSPWFAPVETKWRIFRRTRYAAAGPMTPLLRQPPRERGTSVAEPVAGDLDLAAVVEALPTATMVVDAHDTVVLWNTAAEALYGIRREQAVGHRFRDLDISYRAEGLRARIEDVRRGSSSARLNDVAFTGRGGQVIHVDVSIEALIDQAQRRLLGILVSAVDVTAQVSLRADLQRISEQHEVASEDLQSANEELETTNEELQSTNEELETTNEELQSTNTELLTTVEELQSANTLLGDRTEEVDRLALYHASVVESVREAVVVLDSALKVTTWNQAAERLWRVSARDAMGKSFMQLGLGPVMKAVEGALASTTHGTKVVELTFADAGGVPHTLRVVPLLDAHGVVHGVVATAHGPVPAPTEEA
jgi:two-component system, chemotaxis family, CheB/CheR fusion protein